MRFASTLGLALRRIARRPLRSFLLLQGTVWGVAVALFPSAVITGTRLAAQTRGAEVGADRIAVAADPTGGEERSLVRADVDALARALRAEGTPVTALSGAALLGMWPEERGGDSRPGALVAGGSDLARARGLDLARGRWLEKGDDERACVVEADVATWLGTGPLDVGSAVRLPDAEEDLVVVGVAMARSPQLRRTNDLGFDVEHPLYTSVGRPLLYTLGIPYVEDAWKRSDRAVYVLSREEAVDWIFLRVDAPHVRSAAATVSDVLVSRGAAPVVLHSLVLPFVAGHEIDRFQAVQAALFLACLVMGAVVMANLGLLTALRRSPEIALRRVEGARRRDIALQFLLEGLLLTSVGCLLGCVLGMGLAALRVSFEATTGFTWAFPWRDGLIATAVALLIGTAASLLPALRASHQEPVRALAEE